MIFSQPLSDYFYVWLKRTVRDIGHLSENALTPKEREMTVNHPGNPDEKMRYESLLTGAFINGRDVTAPTGIAVIVFAHKSTSGWEALLEAIIRSGWIVTASWPVDTERTARLNALETASLGSSVHIVCRPREKPDGSLRHNDIGDWRDVLQELPERIHAWIPRLAEEGVVGADAIFACLGPALEIFSRYSHVEKADGTPVPLHEYLEQVWAAVAKEALGMVFQGMDASGFEEDARLTAMWLWTLSAGTNGGRLLPPAPLAEGSEQEDEESTKTAKVSGYVLEYDAARKIAQGLGANMEDLSHLVEIKGDQARLLPVSERTRHLFGKDEAEAPARGRGKKKSQQADLFAELKEAEVESGWGVTGVPKAGATVLDRIHQGMILLPPAATPASGAWPRPSQPSIPPTPTKNAGWMACWPARRDWGSDIWKCFYRSIQETRGTQMDHLNRITVNPEVCGGRPCIRGLRIRVKDILAMLAAGASREEILSDYPYLEDEDITAALEYAARQADHPVLRVA